MCGHTSVQCYYANMYKDFFSQTNFTVFNVAGVGSNLVLGKRQNYGGTSFATIYTQLVGAMF